MKRNQMFERLSYIAVTLGLSSCSPASQADVDGVDPEETDTSAQSIDATYLGRYTLIAPNGLGSEPAVIYRTPYNGGTWVKINNVPLSLPIYSVNSPAGPGTDSTGLASDGYMYIFYVGANHHMIALKNLVAGPPPQYDYYDLGTPVGWTLYGNPGATRLPGTSTDYIYSLARNGNSHAIYRKSLDVDTQSVSSWQFVQNVSLVIAGSQLGVSAVSWSASRTDLFVTSTNAGAGVRHFFSNDSGLTWSQNVWPLLGVPYGIVNAYSTAPDSLIMYYSYATTSNQSRIGMSAWTSNGYVNSDRLSPCPGYGLYDLMLVGATSDGVYSRCASTKTDYRLGPIVWQSVGSSPNAQGLIPWNGPSSTMRTCCTL